MANFNDYASLQAQFERAKENLKDVNENIKKLTGRDPNELRNTQKRMPFLNPMEGGRGRMGDRTSLIIRRDFTVDGPPAKRRNISAALSRLGGPIAHRGAIRAEDSPEEDDIQTKHTVQSSVIAAPSREMKNRKEIMDQQKADSKGMARNKRMFGLLLGTLQRFKDDEQKKKPQVDKRQEIEKKLELAAEKEREDVKKAKQELFDERRKRQADLKKLEQKVDLVKQFEEWESAEKHRMNFIKTKALPPIYYLPAKMTAKNQQRLKQCKRSIEIELLQRKAKLLDELTELDKVREERENIGQMEDADENPEVGMDVAMEGEDGKENQPAEVPVVKTEAVPCDIDSAFNEADAEASQVQIGNVVEEGEVETPAVEENAVELPPEPKQENSAPTEEKDLDENSQSGAQERTSPPVADILTNVSLQDIMLPSDNLMQEAEFEPIYD